jgi:hypothetical protein
MGVTNDPTVPTSPATPEDSRGPWLGLGIGFLIIVAVVGYLIYTSRTSSDRRPPPPAVMEQAQADSYAAKLEISKVRMAQAENMLGGSSTYVEGEIKNTGDKIVTGANVEVTFRNSLNEVVQRENHVLRVVLAREPAIDIGALNLAPLKPGETREFQTIFEHVSADWNGKYPELRITTVNTR